MTALSENLSIATQYLVAGQFHDAEPLVREILTAEPNNGKAWQLLGAIFLNLNDRTKSFDCLNRSLQCDMGNADTWKSLGDYYRRAGDLSAAIRNYEQAIRLRPDFAEAYDGLGCAHWDVPNWSKAAQALKIAAQLRPDDPEITLHFADFLCECGRPDRAIGFFRQVLRHNPRHQSAATSLGFALFEQGYFEEGVLHLRASLELQPNQPSVYYVLSHLAAEGWCTLTPEECQRIRETASSDAFVPRDRSDCAFALALIYQKQGEHDDAMHCFQLANGLKKQILRERGIVFDPRRHEAFVDRIIAKYDRHYFEGVRGWGLASDSPVFIVGMPRSGSTLVDQILATHPHVLSAGEVGDCQVVLKQFTPLPYADPFADVAFTNPGAARQLATAYLTWIGRLNPAATRLINKTLHNFLYLGLIATLFPTARIIHCRRDPYDVCLSCYFANFRSAEFTNSLEDIGAYFRVYSKLMSHWASVLPLPIHEVRYEDLVDHPEHEARKLIAFCGLEWDDACLEYYKSHRVVRTSSTAQVRKPVHKQAVGRWRHYRAHLGPLIEALGISHGETMPGAASTAGDAVATRL